MNLQETIKRILREETDQDDYMEKVNKKITLVKKFMKSFFPDFNREGTEVTKLGRPHHSSAIYTYRDIEEGTLYAKYDDHSRELQLDIEVFDMLDNFLGDDLMTYVIEWFNEEFNQNAEYVTF
jgi:hypothetical protein